jgi:hypothetical protein
MSIGDSPCGRYGIRVPVSVNGNRCGYKAVDSKERDRNWGLLRRQRSGRAEPPIRLSGSELVAYAVTRMWAVGSCRERESAAPLTLAGIGQGHAAAPAHAKVRRGR